MTVIPGQQDAATFLGGTYNSPQMLFPQINGSPNLPQISSANPLNYQPQSINAPYSNPANSSLLNAIQSGAPNSGSNHAISTSNYSNTPMNNNQSMLAGLFK